MNATPACTSCACRWRWAAAFLPNATAIAASRSYGLPASMRNAACFAEQVGAVHVDEDVAHHVLHGLVAPDRTPELLAILRVLVRHVEDGARGAHDRRRLRAPRPSWLRPTTAPSHRPTRRRGSRPARTRRRSVTAYNALPAMFGIGVARDTVAHARRRATPRCRRHPSHRSCAPRRGTNRPTARTRRATSCRVTTKSSPRRCAEHAIPPGPNDAVALEDREADDAVAARDRREARLPLRVGAGGEDDRRPRPRPCRDAGSARGTAPSPRRSDRGRGSCRRAPP